ncbi:hypothetical protein WAI453_013587 [Rhynchosporium graminicola]
MGTPIDYLPEAISEDAINCLLVANGLPKASTIVRPQVVAQYHVIYLITLPSNNKTGHLELVLRVSGHHLPYIKTENEVGVMSWIGKHTTIPIPDIIAYDSSVDNPIAHEYTLLSRVEGMTLSEIYQTLSHQQISQILNQLIDFMTQLHAYEWKSIGGLRLDDHGGLVVGQIVDETFWQNADIEKLWPRGETVTTLNIGGPYPSYIEYISAQVRTNVRLIKIHEKLAFMMDTIPRIEAFLAALQKHANELNNVSLRLAHKDLHFANMLYDASSNRITAILDWEFSGIVPFPLWNPRRSFLWNGQDDEDSRIEKQRLLDLFSQRCKASGVTLMQDAKFSTPRQESMQKVADFLRAIVEVSPREQRADLVQSWKATMLENIAHFDV